MVSQSVYMAKWHGEDVAKREATRRAEPTRHAEPLCTRPPLQAREPNGHRMIRAELALERSIVDARTERLQLASDLGVLRLLTATPHA